MPFQMDSDSVTVTRDSLCGSRDLLISQVAVGTVNKAFFKPEELCRARPWGKASWPLEYPDLNLTKSKGGA
jgi:hypothetical protein